jgi:hypothetical protein
MQKVAPDFTTHRSEAAQEAPPASGRQPVRRPWLGGVTLTLRQASKSVIARATDGELAALCAALLFLLSAWPLALVAVPPLQDLPNHLAATTVIEHRERYPGFVFNGFFKTNSALFTWLLLVGRLVGVKLASRLFVLLVLGLGAIALPRFVLSFGGRRRMLVATFFAWPMVQNWFVSMGMLDFAMGIVLATWLLVMGNAQRQRPSLHRAFGMSLLALATWQAHVFPLLVVHMLVAIHILMRPTWRDRGAQALRLAVPLLPSSVLLLASLWSQLTEPVGAMTGYVNLRQLLPPWELFYNLWAEWFYGFTWLEIATLVPCVTMGLWALYRWRDNPPFLGPLPFVVLGALYFFSPYIATNWFHVNSRFIPFLWLAALVRLPDHLPGRWLAALAACALSYSVGMGIDYVRLENDWTKFTAGMSAVPEGSSLLPLVFRSKGTSENTRSLLHAWGFYVLEKQVSAPLLFAHSRSFPVTYREPPPPQFNHLVLESFAPTMVSPDWMCAVVRSGGVAVDDCGQMWRREWASFWRKAEPHFDHVLMWSAPKDVLDQVPPEYRVVFQQGELVVLGRAGSDLSPSFASE